MFIALPLPEAVKEHLAQFLEPRQEAERRELGPRWSAPEQWHLMQPNWPSDRSPGGECDLASEGA